MQKVNKKIISLLVVIAVKVLLLINEFGFFLRFVLKSQ